jgi:hypothetical protein
MLMILFQATDAGYYYLLPSFISQIKVRPRSSSGLKYRSFKSGDSILRSEISDAEKRMSVDSDSPSPELGLGWASRLGLAGSRAE